ncbi:MAG TPA: condensation domain-containing protein, partial [Chitinophaga sp.]|uniref:condensation domain-containing protein n=1 Tax=Chitinophaga sp. TaxID=1869181 RepID=UPI002C2C3AE9
YTHLYILDDHQQLLPVGVDGEIYLSGQSVAKGYYGKPELTAMKFTENPFIPGMPMYRTGDIGRWLPDGLVAFGGRKDDQVKVRGYRIELGEIQYQLEQHSGVEQAVAIVDAVNEENRILAYWVGEDELSSTDLKAYLSAKLPSYMVPDYWIKLEAIPLNSNGKVDKKKLPRPLTGLTDEVPVVPPGNETERRLLELWQQILHIGTIGVTHNFFDLGGHSLKATRLRSMIAKDFGKDITLNEIFSFPTIAQQAVLIDTRGITTAVDIIRTEDQAWYPISFTQERLWVLTGFEEASRAYNMPAAFRIRGRLDEQKLEAAFRLVIAKHESLRTVFAEREGRPVQIVKTATEVNFSIEKIIIDNILPAEEEMAFLQRKWQEPFDLEKGPLLSCFILNTPAGSLLSFNMHHIISDGWSVTVLFNDVVEAYRRLLAGNAVQLPSLPLQFRDFAIWQRNRMQGERLQACKEYWKTMFEGDLPVMDLPADYPRPAVKTYQGATLNYTFHKELSGKINQLARQSGASLFMALMNGVAVLLKKYTGQSDLVIGTPVAGRNSEALQRQIGFYVNTLAIRTEISTDATFRSLLAAQKERMLEAFEYQDYPFEMLIEDLDLKRDLSRSPLFNVMLVLQNLEGMNREAMREVAPGLQFEWLGIPAGMAKYDLTFSFAESPGGLQMELEYNTSLFKASTVERMARHLECLFAQVVSDPGKPVGTLDILDAAEREEILYRFNRPVGEVAAISIPYLLEARLQSMGDAPAIICGDVVVSYNELRDRSDRIASCLTTVAGLQPG